MTTILRLLLPVTLIAVFIGLATVELARPGFQHAEVSFVPVALRALGQCDVDAAVTLAWGCLPIMQSPSYVGAVKAWLHAPLFAAFGVDVWTVRLPSILLAAASLGLLWTFLRRELGSAWALLALAMLATDPVLISHARIDWGPAMIATLMRVLALVALWYWLHSGRTRWLLLLCAAFLVGFVDKLNFLWVVAAFSGAALLISGRLVFERLRVGAPWQPLIAGITTLLLGWGVATLVRHAVMQNTTGDVQALDPLNQFARVWALYAATFSGTSVMHWVFGLDVPVTAAFNVLALVQIALAAYLLAVWRPWSPARRLLAFLTAALVLLFVAIVATPQVGGTHHLIMLWPLPTLQLVALLAIVSQRPSDRPGSRRPGHRATVATIGAIVCGTQLAWNVGIDLRYVDFWRYDTDYRAEFDTAIGKLAHRVEELGVDRVVSIDAELHAPLVASVPRARAARFRDWSAPVADGSPRGREQLGRMVGDHLAGRTAAFVLFAPATKPSALTRARFDALLRRHALCVRSEESVAGTGGWPLYIVVVADDRAPCSGARPAGN